MQLEQCRNQNCDCRRHWQVRLRKRWARLHEIPIICADAVLTVASAVQ